MACRSTAIVVAALIVAGSAARSQDLADLSKDPKQWPMAAHDYANTRYSELNQITAANVSGLRVAWMFSVGADHGQEAAPLIIGDTLYIISSYPNKVFALDATGGELKWTYVPNIDPASQGVACCDVVTRGVAYDNGKIFLVTLDNHAIALDAKDGKELWATKTGDINLGETTTNAPFVARGQVFVGISGGELGVRGRITALDENTGKIDYVAYSAGPDKDVKIDQNFKPFYNFMKGTDLGESSWPPDAWKIGGGTVWGWFSYDQDLDTLFYGTGNPGPWNSNQRPGDNMWTTTLFARTPETGEAKWAYQFNPHDLWDHDEIQENVLVDLELNGKSRKTLIHPGRNGYMYVIDRETGEVVSADPYDTVNAYKGLDLKTGRIIPDETLAPDLNRVVKNVCPAPPGAKDWQPSAWSPRTKLLYVPHQHLCANFKTSEVGYIAGTPYVGATVDMFALSWRVHGLGSSAAQESLGDPRKYAGLDGRARHGRRRRVLRNHGPLVQGGRREGRQAALGVSHGLGRDRSARYLSRHRRCAICGDHRRRRRMARRDRQRAD
jgi:lanthanide-dependent methanol dehydrogenase